VATALYRRYRPETFAELIGQSHVTDPLRAALRSDRVNHAYLFSGPRGCGKTTSARILARCLNCAEGPTDTPCGVCPSCVELSRAGGGSLDVVEIDAAIHGGVDDARDLRERAVFGLKGCVCVLAPRAGETRRVYRIRAVNESRHATPIFLLNYDQYGTYHDSKHSYLVSRGRRRQGRVRTS
jgi:DNA polymerase III delta prime subunit